MEYHWNQYMNIAELYAEIDIIIGFMIYVVIERCECDLSA